MTSFRGPLNVGGRQGSPTEGSTSSVTIDVSGTSQFTNGLLTVGPSNAAGRMMVVQLATITGTLAANTRTNLRFPPNSTIIDATFIMTAGVSQASAGNSAANVMVGTSAAEQGYFRIAVSGAAGVFRMVNAQTSIAALADTGANASEVYLTVNSQAGTAGADVSSLTGVLSIHYARRIGVA